MTEWARRIRNYFCVEKQKQAVAQKTKLQQIEKTKMCIEDILGNLMSLTGI